MRTTWKKAYEESMYGLANLFFENVKLKNGQVCNYCEDDYFWGMHYYKCVAESLAHSQFVSDLRKKEEQEVCNRMYKFLQGKYGKKLPKVRLENINETQYNKHDDVIELSTNIRKFSYVLRNSSLEQILFMNFLRGEAIRRVYEHGGYTSIFKRAFEHLSQNVELKDGYNLVFNITEEQWNIIAKWEFKKELIAWEIIHHTLKHEPHYYFEDFELELNNSDLEKLRQYFLFKAVANIYKDRKRRSITMIDSLTFKF